MADFNAEPYWDDFEATNGALERNYMRILFRPGYAVQARELTQIQSILQNQIKQFGNHIFKDGSPVIGGHLTLDTGISFVKIDPQFNGIDIDLEDFFGLTVFNSGSPKTRAKVIQTYSTDSERALLIRYIRGTGFTAGQTISTASGSSANVAVTDFTGTGSTVSINEGTFYVDGYFVKVLPQTLVLEPYSATPSYRVGLEIDEETVTESIDNALLDPAQESFNYQAPGAHRYQFSLVLAKRTLNSIDDRRFFELMRVENGVITRQVSYPIYSELEKTLARRTYDESGNYVVKPFRVNISANTPIGATENTSTFIINIEPGKAYVKGFEFETIGTQQVPSTRARTTKANKDYDLSVYYGNRLQLANVQGSAAAGLLFDENLESVDIHCVPNNSVSLSSSSASYYSTRIGSARLRNFDRTTDTNTYHAYLTEINFTPILASANGSSSNTRSVKLQPHFSPVSGAYVNSIVTLISTNGAIGNTGTVTHYDGSTKIATVDADFATTVLDGDLFSLTVPLASAESVIAANTSTYSSANLQANVAAGSKDARGNVFIEDPSFDRNIFGLPNYYVQYNSDGNVDVYRRKIVSGASFTTNGAHTLSLTGSETFDFGTNGDAVGSADIKENLIVVPTSGTSIGEIVDLTASGKAVVRTTSQSITIFTDSASGASYTGDIYVTVKITNANANFRRAKTLVESNSALTVSDTLSSATGVSGYSDVKINASNGIVWFTSANVVSKVPGEKQSLYLSDVIRINKIYDSANISHAPNTTNMVDITDRYTFDSGQTDNFYNHASITLKPGFQPPSGQTAVLVDYFTHTGTGYLSSGSYASTLYENEQIPLYKSSAGRLFNLRDSIDIRPIRKSGLTASPYALELLSANVNVASGQTTVIANTSLSGNVITPPIVTGSLIRVNGEYRTVNAVSNSIAVTVSSPFTASATNVAIELVNDNIELSDPASGGSITLRPTDPAEIDYNYYLPRIDKLVITKDKEFKILNGVPSLAPEEPIETENAMAIYRMYIPAYTATLQSIDLQYIDNRRYTMKDIARIDERLEALEEFVRLRESEQEVISDPPKSPSTPTIDKPIYGTLVDEFDDLSIVDTTTDFAASIEKGVLSCYKQISTFSLEPTNFNDSRIRDKFVTVSYTETPVIVQRLSSNTGNEVVQSAIIAKYEGFITLTPESDYFYSLEHQPYITDSFGRLFEVNQKIPTPDPALDSAKIQSLGGGRYDSDLYTNVNILSSQKPIAVENVVNVPNYAFAANQFEPIITSPININFAGVAPQTFLNTEWTGNPATQLIVQQEPFSPGWNQDLRLSAGGFTTNDIGIGRNFV
jgi:hypothetical protein